MLRAYALADLFSANLSPPISGIFLTTSSGHLVGLAPSSNPSANPSSSSSLTSISPSLTRKLAVLCALTWRFHSAPLSRSASTQCSSSSDDLVAQAAKSARVQPLPILAQTLDDDGRGLSGLIVRGEDRVVTLAHVHEGLLLGVVGKESRSEPVHIEVERHAESRDESTDEDNSTDQSDVETNISKDKDEEGRQLGKVLGVKADALAEYLREELAGFKMPRELE